MEEKKLIEKIADLEYRLRTLENRKKQMRVAWLALVFVIPLSVWAVSASIPHRFADGETLSAVKLNDNFDLLMAKVNAHDTKIEQRLGTFCAASASVSNGNLGGVTGAKAACVTACGQSNAHMCTGHELSLSRQLGITLPAAGLWYSPGVYIFAGGNAGFECTNWTSGSGSEITYIWDGTKFSNNWCNSSYAIACCL